MNIAAYTVINGEQCNEKFRQVQNLLFSQYRDNSIFK